LKIRIFALAKELGLDSKELIEYASEAGVSVKNSALASITPEERDIILKHLEQQKQQDATSATKEPSVPTREQAREQGREVGGKVRTLEPRTARAARRSRSAGERSEDDDDSGGVLTVEKPDEVGKTEQTPATPAPDDEPEQDQDRQTAAKTESPETATAEAETTDEAPPPEAKDTEEPEDKKESREQGEDTGEGPEPIRPDDYVPPPGAAGGGVREMKPRGTVPGSTPRRSKSKPRPQLPSIAAAPNYVPPKQKPPEKKKEDTQPAQKPDIPLTAAELKGAESPLGQRLKKHRERAPEERKAAQRESKSDFKERTAERVRRRTERRRRRFQEDEVETRRQMPGRRKQRSRPVHLKTEAVIEPPITVRSLSEATGRPARDFQRILIEKGEMFTINDVIDEDLALELALEVGVELTIKHERDMEEELHNLLEQDDPEDTLHERPPVITILGHVDHGKTSLLDKIRSTDVVEGEAGGITQHIAAYQVEHNGKKITFVDTPGHAAFGEMRARGAGVTDIVVLVVAADDGVMPQTVECISHAKAAGVPIVVAMNKIDLPDANEQKALQDLAGQELLPAEWGGEIDVVRTSAITGDGLDDLLETVLVTAELHEYKANPDRPALGVCLEAFMDEGRGVLAWLIVQKGTLQVGDCVLCGEAYGRIRAIYNDRNEEIQSAGPSTPVKVAGLDVIPGAGDHFFVLSDIDTAREVAEQRRHQGRTEVLARQQKPRTLEDILSEARAGAVQDLPLIVKADTPGSLEALRSELEKLEHPEVRVRIVHEAVGGVNESDVSLASASGAIIIAFHVIPEDRAAELADREGIEIRRYSVIYKVTDEIKQALEGMLEPEQVEVTTGRALVLQTFRISRYGTIAGCRVLGGTIGRNNRVHVIRDQTVINDYNIASLRREKDDVREVREGMECGIRLDGFNDVKEGDLLEAFRIDKVKRTLD